MAAARPVASALGFFALYVATAALSLPGAAVLTLALGLTPLRAWTFAWVSQVGMLAGTAIYVNAGTRLGLLESPGGLVSRPLLASLAALGLFPLVARRVVGWLRARREGRSMATGRSWKIVAAGMVLSSLAAASWALGSRPQVPPVPPSPSAAPQAPDDDAYGRVLAAVVTPAGLVDYDQLVAAPQDLDAWYASVAWLAPDAVTGWDEPTRIAFWCNVYNGLTLLAIRENLPIRSSASGVLTGAPRGSIRQIPGVWTGLEFQVAGEAITLDSVEHAVLRSEFKEPRIHVAINCASIGCPVLRAEPYEGVRLDAQLADQSRRMVDGADRLLIDRTARRVGLSKIFSWFGGDFPAPETGFGVHPDSVRGPLAFVAGYVSADDAAWLRAGDYTVEFLPYDWHLNAIAP